MLEPEPNRVTYAKTLVELGEREPRIVVLDADISKSTNTYRFQQRFPERFINVGVAEQNMMGIAAGLATTGLIPFANTFAVFASMRACEQVRTAIAYPHLNVKIIGQYAGVEISGNGVTHQAIEDLAILRAFPNMVVLSPSDPVTTRKATFALALYDGPVYLRLGREKNEILHPPGVEFTIGRMIRVREGKDVTIISTGNMLGPSLEAAGELERLGIHARVLDCHTIKPIDRTEIRRAAQETAGIVTAEDHNIVGGLGSAVCEIVAEECLTIVKRVGLGDIFARSGRDPRELLARYKINSREIVKQARELVAVREMRTSAQGPS